MTDNQQAAREWLPIESAPDGIVVLTVCANGTMWIASREDGEWFEMGDPPGMAYFEPTHWQPLPAPPRPTQEMDHEG